MQKVIFAKCKRRDKFQSCGEIESMQEFEFYNEVKEDELQGIWKRE